jgi:hypothetical protein
MTESNLSDVYTPDETGDDLGTYGEQAPTPFGAGDGFADDGKPDEKPPRIHTKRTPIADLVALAWGGVGTALVQTGADVPVGRVLQFEAPLAGKKIDELIAGTWLDTVLQPFAKQADKIEGLGAIVLFPLLVGAYERNQTIGPMVEPVLRQVVRATLTDMAPMLKKRQTDEKKAAAAIADLNDVFDIEPGEDPIQAILAAIFAPVESGGEADG